MDPTAGIRRAFATSSLVARKTLRHWPWLIAGFAVAFGSALGYSLARADAYRSEVLVQVSPAILADFVRGAEPSAEDLKRRIHQLTLSRTRLEQVLGELQPFADRRGADSTETQLAELRDRITIEMHGEDTFLLSFEHGDPAIAQAVTRRLVELFIDERGAARTSRVEATVRLLRGQVAVLLADLAQREETLATFKEEHRADLAALRRPIGAGDPAPRGTGNAPVDERARAVQELRARRAALLAELHALQSAAQSSPEVDALRAEIAEAQRERATLLQRFTSEYPTVAESTRRLAALQRQLATLLAQTTQAPASPRVLELRQRIADLDADLAIAQRVAKRPVRTASPAPVPTLPASPAMTLAEVEAQVEHLDAELATARDQHRQTTTKLFEAEFALDVESQRAAESVKVIDPANRPARPFAPNRPKLLGIGLALGLLLGLFLAFAAGALDTRIFEENDLARAVDFPLLVAIPEYRHGV